MKRYYLSRMIPPDDIDDTWRPKIANYLRGGNGSYVSSAPNDATATSWSLVLVSARDHTLWEPDPDVLGFPDISLDSRIDSIPAAKILIMRNFLKNKGFIANINEVDITQSFRRVLRLVGRKNQGAGWHENNFDVSE